MTRVFTSALFWGSFLIATLFTGAVFAWELGLFAPALPGPLRPEATQEEFVFSVLIVLLIGLNTGLFLWQRRYGSCPVGVKRATGVAAFFGAAALLCPACTVLPIALLGASLSLGFLAPFLPLLRLVTLLILLVVTWMLWPRKY